MLWSCFWRQNHRKTILYTLNKVPLWFVFLSTPCLNFFQSASGLGTLTNWHQTSCHSMQLVSLFVCLCHCLCVIVCFIVDASVSDWHQTSCSSMQLSGDVDEYDPHCKYHNMVIILIFITTVVEVMSMIKTMLKMMMYRADNIILLWSSLIDYPT